MQKHGSFSVRRVVSAIGPNNKSANDGAQQLPLSVVADGCTVHSEARQLKEVAHRMVDR